MKMPLTKHWCLNKDCDFEVTDHKMRDGLKCPKCKGLTSLEYVKKDCT